MPSILELTNIALRRVGVSPILNFTDGTEQANVASDLVPVARDALLHDHNWKFAKKQAALVQYATSPVYGYTYAFLIPSDCLFVIEAKDGTLFNTMNINDQRVLVTDSSSAMITYRARVEDTSLWNPSFIAAFILRLAGEFALSLTANMDLYLAIQRELQEAILNAISTDSIEQSEVRVVSPSDLLDARCYSWSGKKVGTIG